jgi:hypothetical protein
MSNPEIIWTFEYNGKQHDLQADTQEEAMKAADDWYHAYYEDCYLKSGETRSDWCALVAIDNDGRQVARIIHGLYYESTASDFDEHRTY